MGCAKSKSAADVEAPQLTGPQKPAEKGSSSRIQAPAPAAAGGTARGRGARSAEEPEPRLSRRVADAIERSIPSDDSSGSDAEGRKEAMVLSPMGTPPKPPLRVRKRTRRRLKSDGGGEDDGTEVGESSSSLEVALELDMSAGPMVAVGAAACILQKGPFRMGRGRPCLQPPSKRVSRPIAAPR